MNKQKTLEHVLCSVWSKVCQQLFHLLKLNGKGNFFLFLSLN